MKAQILSLTFVLFLITFSSCKKNIAPPSDEKETTKDISITYLKNLGFNEGEIKDLGDEYLVEGDILFSKQGILNHLSTSKNAFQVSQFGTGNYIGADKSSLIISINSSMNAYLNEINSAITQWNSIPSCRIKFVINNGQQATDITITNSDLGAGICGAGYFPTNGQPGALIRINLNEIANLSFEQRQRTITHELGHVVGFRHTNWQGGEPFSGVISENNAYFSAMHLIGTPTGNDSFSLMNAGQCGIGATSLSDYDKIAAQAIYPASVPALGTVPVFRYFNRSNNDHFYTINYSEISSGTHIGYIFEGVGFFAFNAQVANTVPVYCYFNSSSGDHFYTTQYSSYGGYIYEGIKFYAYPSQINNSLAIMRYFNGSDHFYTKDPDNFYYGNANYTLEGTAFYAY